MTDEEVVDLLTLMASFDRRTVGDADVDAWLLAVGDLPFDDAKYAVAMHYRDSRDWLMPSDVRSRVKAVRDARINARPIEAPANPDDEESYRRALANIRRRIGDGRMPFKAIPSGGGAEPGQNEAVAEVRDELAERRMREIRDRNPRPDATGPACECGAMLDPDGFCFTCETRTVES